MPSWKTAQSKKQRAQKTKWALIILALLLILVIFGKAVKFTQSLFNPWQAINSKRSYLWQGDFNINLLVVAKNMSIISFSPQNQTITIVDIPANVYLEVPKGFGSWEVRAVLGLGGEQLLKQTLVNFLGLPIDGFLRFTNKSSELEAMSILEQFKKDPFVPINLLANLKTDLSPVELIRLKLGLSSVRFDKIKQISLEKMVVFQKESLADGTQVLSPDAVKLDSALAQLSDPIIQGEHKTIAVFNSTSHVGLAQKGSRLITNIGGNVIITSNGQNEFKTSKVIGEKSKTRQRLKQIFGKDDKIDSKQEEQVSSRAQISVFLGEDYFDQ